MRVKETFFLQVIVLVEERFFSFLRMIKQEIFLYENGNNRCIMSIIKNKETC